MEKLKKATKMFLMVWGGLLSPSLWEGRGGLLSAQSDSCDITITNIGTAINSPFDEFGPVISADGLMMIFSSNRPVIKGDIEKSKQGMENVYVSYKSEKAPPDLPKGEENQDTSQTEGIAGSISPPESIPTKEGGRSGGAGWTEAIMLKKAINQLGRNNSAIGLSNDGQRMLLYRDVPNGNIYQSDLKGQEWSEPVKLPKPINSDKYESAASVSPDGRTIYFVSNRKGGQGGLDIWLCRKDNKGKWGKAENLGPSINTSKNEEGVFIHSDGKTLYFSSQGHNTIGGHDIFKSVFENHPYGLAGGNWSTPVNLGAPINTPDDDLFFVLTADGKTGYYTASLNGDLGKKDIYEIKFTYLNKKNNEPKLTLFTGMVTDEKGNPIGTDFEIADNEMNVLLAKLTSNSVTGEYLVSLPSGKNYGITVKKEGYLFYSENFDIPDSAAFKQIHKNISLQKINIGNKISLKNIFYDYGKATLRPESTSELNQLVELMNLNTELKIEISSYTDGQSSDEFNLTLSQARAQAVVDFLFVSNINKERLVAKGYGKANPIATNDTEEGRQLNRRTEFKILEK